MSKVRTYFETGAEFEALLTKAESNPSYQDFVQGIRFRFDRFGILTNLTQKQLDKLNAIAERRVPK